MAFYFHRNTIHPNVRDLGIHAGDSSKINFRLRLENVKNSTGLEKGETPIGRVPRAFL